MTRIEIEFRLSYDSYQLRAESGSIGSIQDPIGEFISDSHIVFNILTKDDTMGEGVKKKWDRLERKIKGETESGDIW
jgi:hypothetical protein